MNTAELRLLAELDALGSVGQARGSRIRSVEPVLLSYRYPDEDVQRWSGGELPGVTLALARITTEDGDFGLGETYAGNFAPEAVRELIHYFGEFLLGEDPSEVARLWQKCYSRIQYWGRYGLAISVLSAIECALWDLSGKMSGRPVVDLLGGAVHSVLPRYASGGMEGTADQLRDEAKAVSSAGFRAAKMRGGFGPEEDLRLAQIIRDALSPSVGLAMDVVQGSNPEPWSSRDAIAVGRLLEPLGLLWYEEPCASTDIEGYKECRSALSIPIAGGESCTTVHEFNQFLRADALDIAQPDAAHVGGILEMRKVCALAERRCVEVAVHCWLGAGSVQANYHVGFSAPNCSWLEYPIQPNPFVHGLLLEPFEETNGYVCPPRVPGLGIGLTDDFASQYPYEPHLHYHFQTRRPVAFTNDEEEVT